MLSRARHNYTNNFVIELWARVQRRHGTAGVQTPDDLARVVERVRSTNDPIR